VLLAHGVGTRADLPLPTSYVVIGGAVAVLVSFAALGVLWRQPRLRGDRTGRPVPRAVERVLDSPWLTWTLRAVMLAGTVVVMTAAFAGPPEVPRNIAPWAFYVTFWVGLVPASLLFGPVWAKVNPLRAAHALLVPLVGRGRSPELLARVGLYPAAVSLAAFAWMELASPQRSDPRHVGVFLVAYASAQLVAAAWFGAGWFARGDGFEVYSRLLGRLAVLGRRSDGRLVFRSPLNGADSQPALRGLAAVVIVLVGSTAFDGLTRTLWWQNGPGSGGESDTSPALLGLVTTLVVIGAGFSIAAWLAGRIGGYGAPVRRVAHTLVPIAAGYAVAHYFSLLVFDGQTTYILASDPFDTGANYFGTADKVVDYSVVSVRTISMVQAVAVAVAHVVAVVLSHDRALKLAERRPVATQLPMLVVMVALTVGALAILLGG
jgi:hypothetical protein